MNSRREPAPLTAPETPGGRTVVTTGAAGGIGRLPVERFVRAGATVVATEAGLPAPDRVLTAWQGDSHVAAEAGVVGFTRSPAREVGRYGITASVVTPGPTVTRAVRDRFPPEIPAAQRERRALQRDQEPADLVGPGFFPASEDAAFITGRILNVDGGARMH